MDKSQVDKYTKMKTQVGTFERDVVVLQTKLISLKESYLKYVEELKTKTGAKDIKSAVAKLKQLEEELEQVNQNLLSIFEEFDRRATEVDS